MRLFLHSQIRSLLQGAWLASYVDYKGRQVSELAWYFAPQGIHIYLLLILKVRSNMHIGTAKDWHLSVVDSPDTSPEWIIMGMGQFTPIERRWKAQDQLLTGSR